MVRIDQICEEAVSKREQTFIVRTLKLTAMASRELLVDGNGRNAVTEIFYKDLLVH